MKNAVVFIRKCPQLETRGWSVAPAAVKLRDILGFVGKGRFAVGHRGRASMVFYLKILLGPPICSQYLSLDDRSNEERSGGLSH